MSCLDSLHFQSKILNLLTNKETFDKFIEERNISKAYIRGYLYLIEVTINAFINSIEFLIKDENVCDLIHYKNIKIKDIPKKCRDSSQELVFIIKLEKIRKKFADIRKNRPDDKINQPMEDLKKEVDNVLNSLLSKKKVKVNKKNKANENLYFIVELTNKQNYIETDFDLFEKESEPVSIYPACNYYNLGYQEIYPEYHLQNPLIKNNEEEYIQGYSLGLAFVYDSINIVPKELINTLCNVKNWFELHKVGSKIYNEVIRNKKVDVIEEPIYEEISQTETGRLQKLKIDAKDLRFIFRDRRIFVIEPKERGYPIEIVPFFISLISGRKNFDDKPEIIELKVSKNDEFWYSYAVFIPYGGSLSNASYWVLFKDIAFERGENYKTDGKALIERYLKEEDFIIHRYEVSQKDLERYLRKSDFRYQIEQNLRQKLKISNSLLVELLAQYYVFKKNNEAVVDLEWGTDIKNTNNYITEADLIIYYDNRVLILQAQSSFYKTTNKLMEHFGKVEKFLRTNRAKKIENKKIEKEVFVYYGNSLSKDNDEVKALNNNSIKVTLFNDFLKQNPNFVTDTVKEKLNSCIEARFR